MTEAKEVFNLIIVSIVAIVGIVAIVLGFYMIDSNYTKYFSQTKDLVGEAAVMFVNQSSIVKSITVFKDNRGRAAWSPDESKIAFHKKETNGYYDVYIMDFDGSNERCLTCNNPQLPNKHIGQPSWHPSGNYIVFQAEQMQHFGGSQLAHPGIGLHNDIWLMTSDGENFYQLTFLKTKKSLFDKTPITGILHPHFSHDGTKLAWTERIGGGGRWGQWAIKVADFVWKNNKPVLENVKTYQPAAQPFYVESDDFSSDDTSILISGNLMPGQNELGLDIYKMDLGTGKLEQLTNTMNEFDEMAKYSPDGKKIVWLSNTGYQAKGHTSFWWTWAKTEFWIMNSDGTNKQKLTYFNTQDEFRGKRVIAAYISWHPNGKNLLGSIVVENHDGTFTDRITRIDLV